VSNGIDFTQTIFNHPLAEEGVKAKLLLALHGRHCHGGLGFQPLPCAGYGTTSAARQSDNMASMAQSQAQHGKISCEVKSKQH